jgi:Uma2 family endonuclease
MTRSALRMGNEEFLRWAEGRPGRYELVRGQVVEMMAGATQAHRMIVSRVRAALSEQLDDAKWLASAADCAVEVGPGAIRYPDLVVETAAPPSKSLVAAGPTLIVEVISPSSIEIDLGDKAEEYLSLPSVEDYLVLAQDGPKGWRFSKGAGPAPRALTGRDVVVELPAIGARLPFERIYRGFPAGSSRRTSGLGEGEAGRPVSSPAGRGVGRRPTERGHEPYLGGGIHSPTPTMLRLVPLARSARRQCALRLSSLAAKFRRASAEARQGRAPLAPAAARWAKPILDSRPGPANSLASGNGEVRGCLSLLITARSGEPPRTARSRIGGAVAPRPG